MSIRDFTYNSYIELLNLIIDNGYSVSNYHTHTVIKNPCIIRHDIDCDIEKAAKLAEIESQFSRTEIHSTYFVLLKSNLYNIIEKSNIRNLKKIIGLGHEIGLHFDETQYYDDISSVNSDKMIEYIQNEINIMQNIIESPITSVSMHIPSKSTLESDLKIPGIVNSYSRLFFSEFKYLSDSLHNWRENADEIISSGKFKKLHLLTHPIWYTEFQETMHNNISTLILKLNSKMYDELDRITQNNTPSLSEIIGQN